MSDTTHVPITLTGGIAISILGSPTEARPHVAANLAHWCTENAEGDWCLTADLDWNPVVRFALPRDRALFDIWAQEASPMTVN